MVTVTECTTLGKGRLRFHLDNGTELVLYRGEAKQFRMREGSTLSDEEEHQLIYEVVGKRAKRRTMHLLEQMDRTEQQLREKLKQGGYPQACIDLAPLCMYLYQLSSGSYEPLSAESKTVWKGNSRRID